MINTDTYVGPYTCRSLSRSAVEAATMSSAFRLVPTFRDIVDAFTPSQSDRLGSTHTVATITVENVLALRLPRAVIPTQSVHEVVPINSNDLPATAFYWG